MMLSCALYGIVLILCIGQCIGQDLHFPDFNGAVGGNVEFALESQPPTSSEILLVEWNFGNQIVLDLIAGVLDIRPAYRDRATLDTNTLALTLMNLRLNDAGKYSLSVKYKEQNIKGQTSLVVYENVSDTKLTGLGEPLIESKSIANITCYGNGNITSVQWMKDNNPLNPSDSVIFSSDNRSVSIGPVIRSDSGVYQCTLKNPVSSETAKLNVIINYGPEDVLIGGLREVGLGQKVSLSCSATSVPSASFTWKFNGTDTSVNTETFTIDKTDLTDSGDYLCTARNYVTNQNDSQSHLLVVKEGGGGDNGGDGGGGGLTTGAIVGIVIGVLVAVASICGLIFYLTKTKKIPKVSLGKNKATKEAPPRRQEHELNYAEISHDKKSGGEGVIPGNMNESRTEYAQIKHGASAKPQAPPPPYGNQESKPSSLPEGVTYAQVMKRS